MSVIVVVTISFPLFVSLIIKNIDNGVDWCCRQIGALLYSANMKFSTTYITTEYRCLFIWKIYTTFVALYLYLRYRGDFFG